MFSRSTEIQSILFDVKKWTVSKAQKWLKDHNKKVPIPETTKRYHHFRQADPGDFVKSTFRTIPFGKTAGIKTIIGMKKKKKNPEKPNYPQKIRLPRRVVSLGRCVEVQFVNGKKWKPKRGVDLCSSESGKTLWIFPVSSVSTKKIPKSCLYEAFTGYYVSGTKTANIREPRKLRRSGKVDVIIYASRKWDGKLREYIHRFRSKPVAYTDSLDKPSFVKISGGKIRVKPAGITG